MENPTVKQLLERVSHFQSRHSELRSPDILARQQFKSEIRAYTNELENKAMTLTGGENRKRLRRLIQKLQVEMAEIVYAIGIGGSMLLDLRVDANAIRVVINQPGLFDSLKLVTSLGIIHGFSAATIARFKDELDLTLLSGRTSKSAPEALTMPFGASLKIPLGPPNMFQAELIISTKSGESFEQLIARTLAEHLPKSYLVALEPVPGSGGHGHHH
jgi:hypothetical protein